MEKSTILIVDDHTLIREVWSFILNEDPAFDVIAECSTAEEALELAPALRPQIIILDINLPGMSGLDAATRLRQLTPCSKILGVSMHTQPAYVQRMMKNGAMGYITKNSPSHEMFHALKEIQGGRTYICKEIKDILALQIMYDQKEKTVQDLSSREAEVINYLKKGCSSKEIAEALFISVKTVEVHRYNILRKLNLKNTAALVNFINKNYIGDN
jgi:DNA-binding NarL/FixJ family response regulator